MKEINSSYQDYFNLIFFNLYVPYINKKKRMKKKVKNLKNLKDKRIEIRIIIIKMDLITYCQQPFRTKIP